MKKETLNQILKDYKLSPGEKLLLIYLICNYEEIIDNEQIIEYLAIHEGTYQARMVSLKEKGYLYYRFIYDRSKKPFINIKGVDY